MITLKTESGDKQALIQSFQQDVVSGKVLHVDFKLVEAGKPIEDIWLSVMVILLAFIIQELVFSK